MNSTHTSSNPPSRQALVCAGGYTRVVLAREEGGRCLADALFGMGELRGNAELHDLADESMRCNDLN